ncbi:MAG: hypothetical protein QHC78_18560 [Pigmentiphaga sp.]|uniref:hypothetical protein n=1 Tax=Pigmentiphaga sp. TaxID=1977564 RepID=UPI0029AA36BF|nr:hypothetical protein [Pigmentiphaga sp.]MDX3907696.1 hypothetical protein [Pigmentiphaga sp.]
MAYDNRIKHALHDPKWSYDEANRVRPSNATMVLPVEYTKDMEESLYCPECFTPISRSPKDKDYFSNGRSCCFMHRMAYRAIPCSLRTPLADGKRYLTEEDAKQAIASDQLAIVHSFMKHRPHKPDGEAEPYGQSAVEDEDGPLSQVPIGRHRGETFALPSRITTIAGLCRRFDVNLYKYFVLPGTDVARKLTNLLINIETVTEKCDIPRLYYGSILRSWNAGVKPKPTNIRMTRLRAHPDIPDFTIKVPAGEQEDKGINDESAGRIVIFWGKITSNGVGLAASGLAWGEFALLAEKYQKLLSV